MSELRFEQNLVRALLRHQHPDLADLELTDVNVDNHTLGRRRASRPCTDHPPRGSRDLAEFLNALHHPAQPHAPANPPRGMPLADLPPLDNWFALIADYAHADAIRELFQKAAAAPAWHGAPLWLHADLHPANAIVRDGALAGVIDFGDMCSGDPATDLSAAWILLPDGAAQRFFDAYGQADEATITRARGWAILRALTLIEVGKNGRLGLPGGNPTWEPAGYATLERVANQ